MRNEINEVIDKVVGLVKEGKPLAEDLTQSLTDFIVTEGMLDLIQSLFFFVLFITILCSYTKILKWYNTGDSIFDDTGFVLYTVFSNLFAIVGLFISLDIIKTSIVKIINPVGYIIKEALYR